MIDGNRIVGKVLACNIDVMTLEQAINKLICWARARKSRYVTFCNVHVIVTANQDANYLEIINKADMAAPDGAPVAWMLRRCGFEGQERISGPDLMWRLLRQCEQEQITVYFYGSTKHILLTLKERLITTFPDLRITGLESPPFREPTPEEDNDTVSRINSSGAGIVFVGLGCPKQERWMARHRGRVRGVMLGVGAAFDFHAGTLKRSPAWMREHGLEWAHRLWSEPKRLWRRYLITNTVFILLGCRQLLRLQNARARSRY